MEKVAAHFEGAVSTFKGGGMGGQHVRQELGRGKKRWQKAHRKARMKKNWARAILQAKAGRRSGKASRPARPTIPANTKGCCQAPYTAEGNDRRRRGELSLWLDSKS